MLVHQCTQCGALNINRIAADDPEDLILDVFEKSTSLPHVVKEKLAEQKISLLTDRTILEERLFGKNT
jgi:hypothetical protein